MKLSIRKGFSFGLTSGIITTLGLIIGLHSSTRSAHVIIGGILVIAIADALSDALGIHVSEESENKHTTKEIWESTLTTLLSKFIFSITFIIPILLFPLSTAIYISIIWGLSLLAIFSFYIAKRENIEPYKVVIEHLVIAIIVMVVTHYVGDWVATFG
ncbi:MAG TPA: VIT1/CCC1 transporter family protein [Nitrospinota bacterium]|nr:VIT1/CCC1 transporter family protein [Nitrospinota bacterium]